MRTIENLLSSLHEQSRKKVKKRSKKEPGPSVSWSRANTWRRPTLTGPVVPLPSALRRFTSGFGMGPGGSNALWSPEGNVVQTYLSAFATLDSGDRKPCCFVPVGFSPLGNRSRDRSARSLASIWRCVGGHKDLNFLSRLTYDASLTLEPYTIP